MSIFFMKKTIMVFNYIALICMGQMLTSCKEEENIINEPYTSTIIYCKKYPHEENPYKYIDVNEDWIPYIYQYKEVDKDKLKEWLVSNNSYLANKPYFEEIIKAAQKYDLNPCLLFAIVGKEQSFIPKEHPEASIIANNPFNVFGSWQKYNTNITNSAELACETIIKIAADRPQETEFLKWINTKNGVGGYAEDENWWRGVDKFFNILTSQVI